MESTSADSQAEDRKSDRQGSTRSSPATEAPSAVDVSSGEEDFDGERDESSDADTTGPGSRRASIDDLSVLTTLLPGVPATHPQVCNARFSFETLVKLMDKNLLEAAAHLGVSGTTLKKWCRRFGITRWPGRRVKALKNALSRPLKAPVAKLLPPRQRSASVPNNAAACAPTKCSPPHPDTSATCSPPRGGTTPDPCAPYWRPPLHSSPTPTTLPASSLFGTGTMPLPVVPVSIRVHPMYNVPFAAPVGPPGSWPPVKSEGGPSSSGCKPEPELIARFFFTCCGDVRVLPICPRGPPGQVGHAPGLTALASVVSSGCSASPGCPGTVPFAVKSATIQPVLYVKCEEDFDRVVQDALERTPANGVPVLELIAVPVPGLIMGGTLPLPKGVAEQPAVVVGPKPGQARRLPGAAGAAGAALGAGPAVGAAGPVPLHGPRRRLLLRRHPAPGDDDEDEEEEEEEEELPHRIPAGRRGSAGQPPAGPSSSSRGQASPAGPYFLQPLRPANPPRAPSPPAPSPRASPPPPWAMPGSSPFEPEAASSAPPAAAAPAPSPPPAAGPGPLAGLGPLGPLTPLVGPLTPGTPNWDSVAWDDPLAAFTGSPSFF
eukprot:tig00000405_g452.t1